MFRVLACSQPQRALPLLARQWQQSRLSLAPRRGLSSAPAPGGGGGGGSVGGGRGPRGLRIFSVPGGWRMARKSEDELAAEIEAGSGGQRFPFKVCCSSSGGACCRWLPHVRHRASLLPRSHPMPLAAHHAADRPLVVGRLRGCAGPGVECGASGGDVAAANDARSHCTHRAGAFFLCWV